jgi:hypothetical protein
MKYARIINSVVAEVFIPPQGFNIEDCFHVDLVAQFEVVPDEVEAMWKRHEDGSFSAPPPAEIPVAKV